jgi:glycosyltransferase involved in cell wall biosynthesis
MRAENDANRVDAPTGVETSRLSIALCTYNGARFLAAQLDSIATQTRLPDELVACDDGSNDDTVSLLEQFAARAPFAVRVFRNDTRLGPTKNFEKAIELCTGDLIATCDQDDVWMPEKLALSAAAMDKDPALGLVFGDAEVVEDDLRPRGHSMWQAIQFQPPARRMVSEGRIFEVLMRQWVVTGATMMFRAKHRSQFLPIPDFWTHDGWIALIVSALAPVAMVERCLLFYRQHAAQQIGGKRLTFRELYDIAKKTGPDYFRLHFERFHEAQQRLHGMSSHLKDPSLLQLIDSKVDHQKRRLAISQASSRTKKIWWSGRELLSGGYRRFTPSICAHVAKDMLL